MATQTEKPKGSPSKESPKENYLLRAKSMLLSSVGKLPTSLVVILLASLMMAALTGMVMQLTKPKAGAAEFLPLRLEVVEPALPIDVKQLQGNWIYQSANYAMSITFIGDRYEWIVVFGDVPEAQFYSRGNYRIVGDVMILGIRPDLGTPRDPQKPWMKYLPIAMKNLNTKITLENKQLNWVMPLSEQKKVLAQSGLIFVGHADGIFNWVRR